jgi:ribonucleoside-diphosphate reductase alpha chain
MAHDSSDHRQPQAQDHDLRHDLLRQRYLMKDKDGAVIEDARGMFMRVARAIAAAEANYGATTSTIQAVTRKFFHLMWSTTFLPNSPTLMNAGRPNGLLSACFVLGIEDSIEGIFETIKRTALVQKAGGGTGFAFDTLRPTGDHVASSGGSTSGPISFWRVFAEATNAIQQGAHRRGANMGMLSVTHPDVLNFITAKCKPGDFANFNISIKIPDAFMTILESKPDAPHVVVNPRTGQEFLLPRSLTPGQYGITGLLPTNQADQPCYTVRDIWNLIVTNAHATGEPGVCFIDRVNRDNPTPALGRINATNPCGEQPLLSQEACNLGSIDVAKFVLPDGSDMDWPALGATVNWGVRFLDDVIDANHYPVPEIAEITTANRKIGLGMMGLADALVRRGLRYDTEEALAFAQKLSGFIQAAARSASQELATRRGRFPNWSKSVWKTDHHRPMRNASVTTIAPTGSLSVIAGTSSGIEPIYSLAYVRRALDGQEFTQVHPLLERLGEHDGWLSPDVRKVLFEGVKPEEIEAIPRSLARTLVTALNVSPEWHVRMQAAIQENVDSAVSKTVNLPATAAVEDVDRVYRLAFRLGCKGITVYRDGSRTGQTLSTAGQGSAPSSGGTSPRPRNRVTSGKTAKFRIGCGTLFVTVNQDDKGLCEVFANLGKAGGCPSQSEATCRAISAALRSGVDPKVLIEQLRGIRCLSTAMARKGGSAIDVLSCPDAIARAVEEALENYTVPGGLAGPNVKHKCPHCKHPLRQDAGCLVCDNCKFSSCG